MQIIGAFVFSEGWFWVILNWWTWKCSLFCFLWNESDCTIFCVLPQEERTYEIVCENGFYILSGGEATINIEFLLQACGHLCRITRYSWSVHGLSMNFVMMKGWEESITSVDIEDVADFSLLYRPNILLGCLMHRFATFPTSQNCCL